jgi:hypothetical protein
MFQQPILLPASGSLLNIFTLISTSIIRQIIGLTPVGHFVTYRPIARQRLGKHIPEGASARNNRTSIARPKTIRDNRRRCFPWVPPRGYITGSSKGAVGCCQKLREFSWRVHLRELLSRIGLSSGDGSRRWLRRNDKKWIRLCKWDFMCDLKLQWDGYKSVARIRLVKTKNPSVCATVNWKRVE